MQKRVHSECNHPGILSCDLVANREVVQLRAAFPAVSEKGNAELCVTLQLMGAYTVCLSEGRDVRGRPRADHFLIRADVFFIQIQILW